MSERQQWSGCSAETEWRWRHWKKRVWVRGGEGGLCPKISLERNAPEEDGKGNMACCRKRLGGWDEVQEKEWRLNQVERAVGAEK